MPGGRPRKPTALKVLHGTDRPDRSNPNEPSAQPLGDAPPPSWLKGRGRRAWAEVAAILTEMGVATVADRVALALLCDVYAEYIEARDAVRKLGTVYESRVMKAHSRRADGDPEEFDPEALSVMIRPRPEVAMASDAWRRINTMLQQFGLTPASRSKVSGAPVEEEDPLEALLNKRA